MKNTKTRLQTLHAGGHLGNKSQDEQDKRVMTQQQEKNSIETLQKQADEADMLLPFPELNAKAQEYSEASNQEKSDMLPNLRKK